MKKENFDFMEWFGYVLMGVYLLQLKKHKVVDHYSVGKVDI